MGSSFTASIYGDLVRSQHCVFLVFIPSSNKPHKWSQSVTIARNIVVAVEHIGDKNKSPLYILLRHIFSKDSVCFIKCTFFQKLFTSNTVFSASLRYRLFLMTWLNANIYNKLHYSCWRWSLYSKEKIYSSLTLSPFTVKSIFPEVGVLCKKCPDMKQRESIHCIQLQPRLAWAFSSDFGYLNTKKDVDGIWPMPCPTGWIFDVMRLHGNYLSGLAGCFQFSMNTM